MPNIYERLIRTQLFSNEGQRQSILREAGLDAGLLAQINISGAPIVFLTHCLGIVSVYGKLSSGKTAFRALMAAVKNRLGEDWETEIDSLTTEWEMEQIDRGMEGITHLMRDDAELRAAALRFRVI